MNLLHSNIGYLKCEWKYILNIVKDKERYISENDSSSKHRDLILKTTLVYIHLNIYVDCHRKNRQNHTDKGIILTQLCVTFRRPGVTVFNKNQKEINSNLLYRSF